MERSSGTPSSHQLAATPTSQFAYSSSSGGNGGGQGGGNGTPPIPPRFNLPDSYWTHQHVPSNAERFMEQSSFTELVAKHAASSNQVKDVLLKALEQNQEDRENDPRSRIQDQALHIDIRQFLVPDFSLSPETLAGLVVLKDSDNEEVQLQSSTSTTSAAIAVQEEPAASGCFVPPACTIL